jgi:hypothetical protein
MHATTNLTAAPAVWHRYPRLACAASLPAQARIYTIVTASEAVPTAPRYTVVDCHSNGASYYTAPRYSLAPALTEWQAEVIAAVQRLRRWRYYSDSPD